MDLTSSATTPADATTEQPPSSYDHQSHYYPQQQQQYLYDPSYYYQHYYYPYYLGSGTLGPGPFQDPNSVPDQFAAGGLHYFRPSGVHFPYRGGAPFRGGGRGKSAGRGRGRGGRHGLPSVASSSDPESSAQANAQPVPIAWCELCRVECTSKEILEQHNNGKRHKKNLQKLQNMKITSEPVSEIQKDENSLVQETEADIQSKIIATDSKVEAKEYDIEETKPRLKRKMKGGSRGGRGGKRMKPTAPPRPKVVIPLMCDLCNVKCDTQEVFNRHTAGKKHMTKVKRFEGHQAMYGPTAVQVLYPPNPLSQTLGPQPASDGAPESYGAPPLAYIPPPQAQNPNPQLADAPLEFGTQKAVSEPQVANVSAGESYAGNGVQ